jgi:ubiquinone/menaquinone biosynthesis C-methylase UbiE
MDRIDSGNLHHTQGNCICRNHEVANIWISGMTEHHGEHEIFDRMWSREELFYNEGDVAKSRTFLELWESVKFQHLAEEFPKNPLRTLEVGCGSGGVSLYFHNTCGYDVELVDLSDEALSFAQHNFEIHGQKPLHATFRKDDATHLSYPDDTFDLVMSFGLLEHFTDIATPICEQMRVLKPGGLFFADIVTERFSVDTFARLPGMAKNMINAIMHGKFKGIGQACKIDFFENNYPLVRYCETVEKCGGKIQFARGNRPFTSLGRVPLLAPALLNFYKMPAVQRLWQDFDASGSAFSEFWGAGWWILAKKE